MIGYIVVLAAWSLLMVILGICIRVKDNTSYIETLKNNSDFHKSQKEQFIDETRKLVKENNNLKERNLQLLNENKTLKEALDNQGNVTDNSATKRVR